MKDTNLNFRISSEKKDAFNERAKKMGRRTGDILNELIDKFLEGSEDVTEIKNLAQRLENLENKVMGKSPA